MSVQKPREIYVPIHALPTCSLTDPCPNLELVELEREGEKYCVAYCKVLERYLTKSAARKCESTWRGCPFAKLVM
ncbi:hypothetical protein [Desulfurococcus mucosus]|uniref:Uncharacterized protein n=1 Tax=Desulfurococcus mucosus (strain ATCC 35584 / DSM 2162 / JCM 9187 / O7/1) TaxID=765177 RepID=E8R6Z3_DESM0|nr:hypothetical protein [Desulfurococcus mucosus]ADV64426.1 hypothetical protein Desmu_0107 [Desulfurococcus mucosus DSM 2162]